MTLSIKITCYIILSCLFLPFHVNAEGTFVKGAWHSPYSVARDHYCPDIDWDLLDSLGITHVMTRVDREGDCEVPVLVDIGDRGLKIYGSAPLIGDNDCQSQNGCENLSWYGWSGWALLEAENQTNPDSSCTGEPFYGIIHETGQYGYDWQKDETAWRAIPSIHEAGYLMKQFTGWEAYWKYVRPRYGIYTLRITDQAGPDTLKVARLEIWKPTDSGYDCSDTTGKVHKDNLDKEILLSDFKGSTEYQEFFTDTCSSRGNLDYRLYWYGTKEMWVDKIEERDTCSDRLFNLTDSEIQEIQAEIDSIYYINPGKLVGWYFNDEPFLSQLAPLNTVKTEIIDGSESGQLGVTNMAAVNKARFFHRYLAELENVQELAHDVYKFFGDDNCNGTIKTDTLSYPYNSLQSVQTAYDTLTAHFQMAKEAAEAADVPFWAIIQVQAETSCSDDQECYDRYGGWWKPKFRDPIAGELRAQVYLALAYGAQGVWYFLYPSIYPEDMTSYECIQPWPPYVYHGLIDRETPEDSCYTVMNYKYHVIKGINDTLDILTPSLLDPGVEWDVAGSALDLPITGSNIQIVDITTTEVLDSLANVPLVPPDPSRNTYVHVGIFTSTKFLNPDYLMVVNRRSTKEEARRTTLDIVKDPNSNYVIKDILSGQKTPVTSNSNGLFTYTIKINPGCGRLLKITDVTNLKIKVATP